MTEELEWSNVSDLGPSSRSVNLKFQAIRHTDEREVTSRHDNSTHRVSEVLVGDPSGVVLMTVWDDIIDQIKEGQSYILKNGYTSLFRGNIRLNIGRYGEIMESEEAVEDVNEEENISERTYEQPRRYRQYNRSYSSDRYNQRSRGRRDRRRY
ncbi:MAG: hypothetical protein ACTSW4_02295 [Candidatus Ranarchaeia archaeon]